MILGQLTMGARQTKNSPLQIHWKGVLCVNPWKCYTKFVYMKTARDKFHVWSWHLGCHWHWHWHLTITSRSQCDQFQMSLWHCLQFMTNWEFQIMILMKLIVTQTATLDSIHDSCDVYSSAQYSYIKTFQKWSVVFHDGALRNRFSRLPAQSARKFSAVLGTTSPRSSRIIRPRDISLAVTSRKTLGRSVRVMLL